MATATIRIFVFLLMFGAPAIAQTRVNVRMDATEAEAVLRILEKREKAAAVTDTDWSALFATEGYVRLKKRETGMGREFTDLAFREFVMSDDLLKRKAALAATLERWKRINTSAAADRALAYLPSEARITAKIYPVIKPRDNSFVFEIATDPAIFLYLDPKVNGAQFENTLAHELHHIGFGTACPTADSKANITKMTPNVQNVVKWVRGFGEGFAMLAAAGGSYVHPHAVSEAADRERWDKDVANFNTDFKKIESFFLDVVNEKLTGKDIDTTAFTFFGVQGPWYTVGWKMSVTIEKVEGRKKLIECFCNPETLLEAYNRAARKSDGKLTLWSDELLRALSKPAT